MNTVANTVEDMKKNLGGAASEAGEMAEHAGKSMRKGFLTTMSKLTQAYGALRSIESDTLLAGMGLQRRTSALRTIAVFAGGFALGSGVGMLLAPTAGAETRKKIGEAISAFFGVDKNKADENIKDANEKNNDAPEKTNGANAKPNGANAKTEAKPEEKSKPESNHAQQDAASLKLVTKHGDAAAKPNDGAGSRSS